MKKVVITGLVLGCVSLFVIAQKFGAPGSGVPGGFPGGEPPEGMPPEMPGEFGSVPDEAKPELEAETIIEEDKALSGGSYAADAADKSVLLVKGGAHVSVADSSFAKSGGNTTNDGQSNFYGLNAAVVVTDGVLELDGVTVTSDADGANAVFSTGENSRISIDGITVHTKQNSSRGLDSTYGGTIIARNVDIVTEGAHSAAFATDRGEGTVTVEGGTARTSGEGSPVIYSTGNISVSGLKGSAESSEIAVIEGKNSITLKNSELTGGIMTRYDGGKSGEVGRGIMLYQSMSGDAGRGTSVFRAEGSVLTSTSDGAFFYVTNTASKVFLTDTRLVNASGKLIQVSQNNSERGWGRRGANGGTLEFTAENQVLEGDITVDEISTADLHFNAGTVFTGAINSQNQGKVDLYLEKSALLTLTADSYVNVLSLKDKKGGNITSNGHTIFYNKNAKENKWLKGRTLTLKDGGKLVGIEMEFKTPGAFGAEFDSRQRPPAPPDGKAPSGTPPAGLPPQF